VTELVVVLDQIENVLKHVIEYYHDHLGINWGWSIVLLTATVRIAILPLTIKQFRSMAAMQRIQPKVKALQNKYKGKTDPESRKEQQAELMALYKEHNVNPFASCLPMVFQIPIFIGLYSTLRHYHPAGDRSFLGIHDIFLNLHTIGGATEVIMVALYAASMLGSTLLFSFVQDRQQKFLFAAMSVTFTFFIVRVPAGVGIYWITTNLWTIAQQGIVKRTMGHHFPVLQKEEQRKHADQPRSSRNPSKRDEGGGSGTRQAKGGGRNRPGGPRRPKKRR
jgi:YidC/Oxa1 family membrane protein insertase